MTFSDNRKGVTLIELMVVIGILGLISGLLYSIFISQLRAKTWQDQITEMQQGIRGGMDLMLSDLLKADAIYNTSGICNTAISLGINSETITYILNGTTLERWSSDTGKAEVSDDIIGLSIDCYDRTGHLMELVNASSISSVRRMKVSLTGRTANPNPDTGEYLGRTILSSTEMRNLYQVSGTGCGMLKFTLSPTIVAFCDPPGEVANITMQLCELDGTALGGTVEIYPRVPLPLSIEGENVTIVNGIARLTIPSPSVANTLCSDADAPVGTAIVNATDPSELSAGTGVEMVSKWTPEECDYDIVTSRSLNIEAGDPYDFEYLTFSPDTLDACQSENQSTVTAEVVDNCGNPISGETVTMSIVSDDGTKGVLSSVTDNTDGTYTALYNAGTLAQEVTIEAIDTGIVNDTDESITNAITLEPHDPAQFALVSGSPIVKDECPNNTSIVEFKVQDACGNTVTENQTESLSSTTDRGSMGAINAVGAGVYNTPYYTPVACGPGAAEGVYNVTVSHTDIGSDLTVPLTLNKCPAPGVNLNLATNTLPAGCPDNTISVTATILKNTCEPDPTPANVTFEVKNDTSGAGYGDLSPRNGRFDNDEALRTVYTETGSASALLNPGEAAPGDVLTVHAVANITPYGEASYTSNEFTVDITNSTSSGDFYTDGTFTTPAVYYNAPTITPVGTEIMYLEVRDCDENGTLSVQDTVDVTLTSSNASGIINTMTVSLIETDVNTGVFTNSVSMRRSEAEGVLYVDKGGNIAASYTDDDDAVDTVSGSIFLTGCRGLKVVDSSAAEIIEVIPDIEPYDSNYPDGDNAFHLIANIPVYAGDGTDSAGDTMWFRVHTCTSDASTGDEDSVKLTETGDSGAFIINGTAYDGFDYIYVGEGVTYPQPGGHGDVGLRVPGTPETITIIYPDANNTCDTSDANVQNFGCSGTLPVNAGVCSLTGLAETTRNADDTITVNGTYLLNGSATSVQLAIGATDGTTTEAFSGNDPDGTFSWTSTSTFASPVTVTVTGVHGNCETTETLVEGTNF